MNKIFKTGGTLRRTLAGIGPASLVLGAMFAASGTTDAQARDLRIAIGLPETYQAHKPLVKFAESLEELGLKGRVFPMSLLKLSETPAGVRDGIADVGFVASPYHPAEFSEMNLAANLSMLATSGEPMELPGAVMAGAMMEYILLECTDCQAQMGAMNQVYISGTSSSPFGMICNTPIESTDDIRGKKFRVGAQNHGRWVESFGGVQISATGNEMYELLGNGGAQCTINAVSDLLGSRLVEVSNTLVVGVPGATFSGLATNNFNADVWKGLTTEQRRGILDRSARLAAEIIFVYYHQDKENMIVAEKAGHKISISPPQMVEATQAFVKNDIDTVKKQFTEQYAVPNAVEKVDRMIVLIDKWKELVASVGTDEDALADLYLNEILSKVDAETYGMN